MSRILSVFLPLAGVVLLGALVAGCKPGTDPAAQGDAVAGVSFETRFPVRFGGQEVRLQVALTELEKARGLMGRQTLAEHEGMLFVFPRNEPRSFWMRDVPINLALGYLTEDGKLDEVKVLLAQDPSSMPSRSNRIRYVIELPEGWFERNGVAPGAQLDLAAVRAAIAARGFQPERFLRN